ncbi:MAG TPA: HEAT repeat domain-containing protein [Tepidisphaeraceae bacterium]|nr:HEAT repeat domain-containing protein [Tepidisphaeraceae bacterium]
MTKRIIESVMVVAIGLALVARAYGQANPSDGKELSNKLVAVLKSDASHKEKADACRQLALVGTKDAVGPLAELLADEQLSHMARYGLETIADPAVDDAFRAALGKLQGRPLVGVIYSIGVRRDAKAVEALAKLLKHSDADTAQAAARSLGKIGTLDAAKAIEGELATVSAKNQLAFCEGLLRCAEALAANGQRDQAAAIYDGMRKLAGPHQVRTAALRGAIMTRQKEEGVAILREQLQNQDYLLFAAAVRTSYEMPGVETTLAMAEAVSKLSGDNQILVIQTLGNRKDEAAMPALFAAAKSDVKRVRQAAIQAMPKIGSAAAVPVLLGLMGDSDREIAQLAKESFASFPGQEADAAVVAMLGSGAVDERLMGIELVGRRRMTTCTAALLKAAGDADGKVRLAATRRLGELASVAELPAMLDLLMGAKASADLNAAEAALAVVCGNADNPQSCSEKLVARMAQAQPEQKVALLRVLSGIGGSEALKAMRATIADSNADARVRATAIRSLGTWKTADAAEDLLALAKSASSPADKVLGLRSYLGLASHTDLTNEQRLAMCKQAAGLVQRDEEKRLLLGTLGGIKSVESVALIMPYLDDAAVKEEAGIACTDIADTLLKGNTAAQAAPKLIQPLEKVTQVSGNAELTRKAKALLQRAQGRAGGK